MKRWWRVAVWVAGFGMLTWVTQGGSAPAEESKPHDTSEARDGQVRAKALLDESHWTVELQRMFADEALPAVPDTLIFSKGLLTSAQFTGLGYSAGPFTLSIGASGLPVWEATQLNPSDGIVLWRGELDRDVIRGTVSRLPLEGASEDFRFEGKETLAGAPPIPPEPVLPQLPEPDSAVETPEAGDPSEPTAVPSESSKPKNAPKSKEAE